MISMDPPRHDRLKALVIKAFTAGRVAAARGGRQADHQRCARLASPTASSFDLVADVARPDPGAGDRLAARHAARRRREARALDQRVHRVRGPGDPRAVDDTEARSFTEIIEYVQRPDRGAPRAPARRPAHRPDECRGRRREAQRARDRHLLRPADVGGQRLDARDLQRDDARAAAQPGAARAAAREPRPDRRRRSRRGCAASPRSRSWRARRPRTPSCTARRSRRATACCSGTSRPTATRACSPTRTSSTSPARDSPTSTRPSAAAAGTSASAPTSRGSSSSCGSSRRWSASRTSSWTASRPRVRALFLNQYNSIPVRRGVVTDDRAGDAGQARLPRGRGRPRGRRRREAVADGVVTLTLADPDGADLPEWTAGRAHRPDA